MAKNVVGLFEAASGVQAAVRDLEAAGFNRGSLGVMRGASGQAASTLDQLGIPQDDAAVYQSGLSNGGAMVVLQQLSDDDAYRAAEILDRHNIVDIDRMAGGSRQMAAAETRTSSGTQTTRETAGTSASRRNFYQGGEMVIPIVEEELHVGKREVEAGGVRVHTHVEEIPVSEQVTVRDEQVEVARVPVNQPIDASTGDIEEAFRAVSVEMRETDEQVVVGKQARVVEEVVIDKDVQQRTETIQDTVRRTDVDVEETGANRLSRGGVS